MCFVTPSPAMLGHMSERKPIESWLSDMDGVLVHEGQPVPGADEFIRRLKESGKRFLVLTNNSIYTPETCPYGCARPGWRCRRRRSGPPRWPPQSSSPTSGPRARRT
ncbi:hypothetical protein GCM10027612_55650 [Microbispora bryophytorum subsp. camponoti]